MLWICAILTLVLAIYALGYYISIPAFLLSRRTRRLPAEPPVDAVTVLIPSRNEGEVPIRAIRSVLDQDHRGRIDVRVLLKDRADTSVPFLEAAFPRGGLAVGDADRVTILDTGTRSVTVAFGGEDAKSAKLNRAAAEAETPFLAILDADHRAHPEWIRSGLGILRERGARMVQGRRNTLSALGFFQLWDSLHQHVGCELFNGAFTRLGLTVFFTGTTAILETALLREFPLLPCITEDVDLSYRTLLRGIRTVADPAHGSDEEVSPDLYSFLARRRRWACGHTAAFLRHLPALGGAPLAWKDRIQFVCHGVHYLVAFAVYALHAMIGLVFVQSLAPVQAILALLAGGTLAAAVAGTQPARGPGARITEVLLLTGWFAPAVAIAMNLVQALLLGDPARASVPIPDAIQVAGLAGLAAPLVALLAGLVAFRQAGLGTLARVVLTFPAAFYLDVSGVLLGLADCLVGRREWLAVARPPFEEGRRVFRGGIRVSCRVRELPASLARAFATGGRASNVMVWVLVPILFGAGAAYTPAVRMPVAGSACQALEHDGHPWIVPPARLSGYCDAAGTGEARRVGTFRETRRDDLGTVDPAFWDRLSTTFFCNLSTFAPENVEPGDGRGVRLRIDATPRGGKECSAGSIATKDDPAAKYLYGRFEADLKPARGSGILTAFFLYRFDPWQEIDAEFLGRDPTKLLANVYYNPGEEGDLYNYGYRGTPVLVDLGFDASQDFHRYAIEWDPEEIRWFVDDRVVHARGADRPTPIPHLPMRLHVNAWPMCSEELAGPFRKDVLPVSAGVGAVTVSAWEPFPFPRYSAFVESLVSGERRDWRGGAGWMGPGR